MAERKKIASGIHEGFKKTSAVKKGSIPTKRANESIKSFIGRLEAYDARRLTPGFKGSPLTYREAVHPTGRDPVPRKLGRRLVQRKKPPILPKN